MPRKGGVKMIKCTKKGNVILNGDTTTIVGDILSTTAYFYRMAIQRGGVRLGTQVLDTIIKYLIEIKEEDIEL
jgi:hypothetical protein